MLGQSHNAGNKQDAAWRQFIELLEYKGEQYGTPLEEAEPEGTTKECTVETALPVDTADTVEVSAKRVIEAGSLGD